MNEAEIRAKLQPVVEPPLPPGEHRLSAVLIPLEPDRGVWLTRRANLLANHAGQVSFPGGKIEPSDVSPEAAALREAREEIGLKAKDVKVLGRLADYITGTGFHITPVIGLVRPNIAFKPAPSEVAAVFCLPFNVLVNPAAPVWRSALFRGERRSFWVWPHEEHFIWGATAEILVNLARRLRGQP